jgi:stress-induced-phosphoprotein 1
MRAACTRRIQQIAQNPSLMQMHMQDPRIQTALSVMLGMGAPPGGPTGEGSEEAGSEPSAPAPAPPPAQAPAPPPVELTEEEKAHAEVAKKAEAVKKLGAALFSEAGKLKKDPVAKKAKVEEAKLKFEEALAINPIEMAYLSNIAACLFELKQHDECIDMCNKALEVGKEYRVDFTMLAKAHARIGILAALAPAADG